MARNPRNPRNPRTPSINTHRLELDLSQAKDLPVQGATGMVVNFTGFEFLVTVVSAYPAPWVKGEAGPSSFNTQVLARYTFNSIQWQLFLASATQQLDALRNEGAPLPDLPIGALE